MRVAIYARVPTADKDQNPENQLMLLRREAQRAGDTIIKEYVNEKSAVTPIGLASSRCCSMPASGASTWCASSQPVRRGVQFWSYSEPTMNNLGPMSGLFTSIFAGAANYNNQRHSQSVRLGQARKRAEVAAAREENQYGRRPIDVDVVAEVKRLGANGLSIRKISNATGVSVGTVQKYLKQSCQMHQV